MEFTSNRLTEAQVELELDLVSKTKKKNERLSWARKREKMERLVEELEPVEDRLLEIYKNEKLPILDKINELRTIMVKECVHPRDMLVHKGTHVECKFCQSKLILKQNADE